MKTMAQKHSPSSSFRFQVPGPTYSLVGIEGFHLAQSAWGSEYSGKVSPSRAAGPIAALSGVAKQT